METSSLTGHPSAVTQKHREVTFEDEVPRQLLYRACSQPLLNSYSELPSGVTTLHRVLHFGEEISEAEWNRQKPPHKLTRYHSEEDLLDTHRGHGGHTQPPRKSREHMFRRRCASAMAEIITSINHENVESSMQTHRASPAVVLPVSTSQHVRNKPPRPPAANKRQQRRKCPTSPESLGNSSERGGHAWSDQELDDEVMRANGFITDRPGQHSDRKRFQLPWRKNRGRYTPSKEIKKMAKAQPCGHSGSCSSCSSPCANQMAPVSVRSNCAEPRSCRTPNMKTPVAVHSQMTAPPGGIYEAVREFRAPVNTVHNGDISHKPSARLESDYETVDAVNRLNKLSHGYGRPPTGRNTNKKRHIVGPPDRDYNQVTGYTGDVERKGNHCSGLSQQGDSDYEIVDSLSRTAKPLHESIERNGHLPGHVDDHTTTEQGTVTIQPPRDLI